MEAHRLYPVWNGRVLEVLIRRLDLDGSGLEPSEEYKAAEIE
jgi:hypothetical protein